MGINNPARHRWLTPPTNKRDRFRRPLPTIILAISALDNLRCPTSAITDGVGQLLSREWCLEVILPHRADLCACLGSYNSSKVRSRFVRVGLPHATTFSSMPKNNYIQVGTPMRSAPNPSTRLPAAIRIRVHQALPNTSRATQYRGLPVADRHLIGGLM